jgi:hypothetical protein
MILKILNYLSIISKIMLRSIVKLKKTGSWILPLVVFLSACQSASPHVYTTNAFTFNYPSDWRYLADIWPLYQPSLNYNNLGISEIITITSASRQKQSGAHFTVAALPLLVNTDLESLYRQTYTKIASQTRETSESTTTVAGLSGFMFVYQRPLGEPWWQFGDIWLAARKSIKPILILFWAALPSNNIYDCNNTFAIFHRPFTCFKKQIMNPQINTDFHRYCLIISDCTEFLP